MHPTLARYIERAVASGITKARTAKGILAAVKKHGNAFPQEQEDTYRPRVKWRKVVIADPILARHAEVVAAELFPRKKNIRAAQPTKDHDRLYEENTFRYKGNYSKYTSTEIIPLYCSYVAIAKTSRAVAQLWQSNQLVATRFAPAGLKWSQDTYGAKLVDNDGYDYHPSAADFKSPRFVRIVRDAIRKKKRLDAERKRKEREDVAFFKKKETILRDPKKLAKIWVTRDDSLNAGNCAVGTDGFIQKLHSIEGNGIGAIRADYLQKHWGKQPHVIRVIQYVVAKHVQNSSSRRKKQKV